MSAAFEIVTVPGRGSEPAAHFVYSRASSRSITPALSRDEARLALEIARAANAVPAPVAARELLRALGRRLRGPGAQAAYR